MCVGAGGKVVNNGAPRWNAKRGDLGVVWGLRMVRAIRFLYARWVDGCGARQAAESGSVYVLSLVLVSELSE